MAQRTILNAALKPGGKRSRTGESKSLPKRSAFPGMVVCGVKMKEMEYWS